MTLLLLLGAGGATVYADSAGFSVADPEDTIHPEFARWCNTDSEIIRRGLLGEGITNYQGGLVTAQSTPNLSVLVAAYTATLNGGTGSGSAATLPIPLPDVANDRIDLVTLDDAYAIRLTQGTPSGIRYPPDLPLGHLALAYLYVGAQVTQIREADVWDKRCLQPS